MVIRRDGLLGRNYLEWRNYFSSDIAVLPQLFLNGCADACAASILAILSAIAQAQFKYDWE